MVGQCEKMNKQQGVAVVVGGSVAGLACAHAISGAGWEVVVLEKASGPAVGGGTGAGLGLDKQSMETLSRWISGWGLDAATLPLAVDMNVATDSKTKAARTLASDESFTFSAAHWSDVHLGLHAALPASVTVLWGHQYVSFAETKDKRGGVVATARVLRTGDMVEVTGDMLVAADGSQSSIRRHFLPDLKLRYAGYCAWRGVFDFGDDDNSKSNETMAGIRKAYPELGTTLYSDLAYQMHAVLYQLSRKRLNWLWYINGPEPELTGTSVTIKATDAMVAQMRDEADRVWRPELARLIRETERPFVNVIYDADPLPRLSWAGERVVLVGEAAHPTTPHGLRSTNMSLMDARALGWCLANRDQLPDALAEYEKMRLPVVSAQVLQARRFGKLKQGLPLPPDDEATGADGVFDPSTATPEQGQQLLQRTMPYYAGVPVGDNHGGGLE